MSLKPAFGFADGALLYRTDVGKGPVFGRTITTDVGTGNIIVALLAVLRALGTYLGPFCSLFLPNGMELQLDLTNHAQAPLICGTS
jgi:hypothetical protein